MLVDIPTQWVLIKINLPLLDAIKQVPAYTKFLKDLCTQKRQAKVHVPKKVCLTEQVSSILQLPMPTKFKDPGAPTISCVIGTHTIDKALLDLGASVNLLPYSVYKQFGLGELKPTSVSLQLADRSIKIPRGIIEDVLVKVDRFYYPVDFLVLDMEPAHEHSRHIPVILGRPFLATANACINCRSGGMDLSFGNMTVNLNIFDSSQNSPPAENCHVIEANENPPTIAHPQIWDRDPRESCLARREVEKVDIKGPAKDVESFSHRPPLPLSSKSMRLNRIGTQIVA